MSQPVTTNPLIIMLINMTVVFLVLIALGLLVQLIHVVDPTKQKSKPVAAEPAPAPEPVTTAPATTAVADEGISPETIAVIAAAIASYGYGISQIHAIRPLERNGWKNSGRAQLTQQV